MDERLKNEIIKEAKRTEECAIYSSKSHYAASKRYELYNFILGISITVLSSLAASINFTQYSIWITLISILITVLGSVLTFCKFSELSVSHFNAGNDYSILETNVRNFYNIDINCENDSCEMREKLKYFVDELNRLNKNSPIIKDKDYKKAKEGIIAGEASFDVDRDV